MSRICLDYFLSLVLLLIIKTEVIPPDITPNVNEVPTIKPIGSGTVLFTKRFKVCFLLRFCDPRQRKKIRKIAEAIFMVRSFNLKNIDRKYSFIINI
tara:strand:+ start:560 stop:850 length:291 start_codon:yes stop_codon:yes gene_type:complete